jgi:FSR family fosmidomycin resistance protein-like MFS transporter
VLGLASTALIDATELALVDVAGDELPATLARVNLFGAVGDLLGPLVVVGATALGFGWRAPFVVSAVALFAFGLWLVRLPLPSPRRDPHRASPARALGAVARDPRVWFFAAVAVLLGPLDEPFLAFVIAFAQEERGLSASAALGVAFCSVAGTLVGFAARAARPSARAGGGRLGPPAAGIAAAAVTIVLAPWTWLLVAAAFGFGVALAGFWNTTHARILTLRPGQTGTVKAFITTIEFAGFGLPIAYGAVADAAGVAAGLACYAATACALAALVTLAPRARASRPARA